MDRHADVSALFNPVSFRRGPAMANRFMLAPLTNSQSHPDGTCSTEEHKWLTKRAEGGFGATMTAAAHVSAHGQGFPGQIGVFADAHIEGLTRLASTIKAHNSVSLLQLHHAGNRAPADLIGATPVFPSDHADTGARALTAAEVEETIDAYVDGAVRADRAGFDGVEVHGAHGYLVSAFLSPELNQRTDRYGGSLENRARFLFAIVDRIRRRCRPDFIVGVRLSPERFGVQLPEIVQVATELLAGDRIEFLDMSLWDCFKKPADNPDGGRLLIDHFTEIPRGETRLGVAGKLRTPDDIRRVIDMGVDLAVVGRAAIIHHDLPKRIAADPAFEPIPMPVPRAHLLNEMVSPGFLHYLDSSFKGFVAAAS
jgi:2,4-dienoyl-CoA reductase-like NADH-dependent reductase (Old Yellow Enzyme family)